MIYAAIDIGSNAGRLLVATVHDINGKIITEKITLVRVPLRLGFDVFEKGYITPEKQDLLINTFDAYKQLMNIYEPVDYIACATAAMREAENAHEVLERVKNEAGVNLITINGQQEAEIISSAGNANLEKPHLHSLYIDVGGGSTEISWFEGDKLLSTKSFKIGTIRLLHDLVAKSEWDDMKEWVKDLHDAETPINCICSGGNINKLTKLYGNRTKNTLSYSQLVEAHEYLEGYSIEDRMEILGFRADRADVIIPAAIIFKKLMKWAKIQEIQAPKIGLADGLIVELYKKGKNLPTVFL
ncbi:MAG: ethanolamine ammonia-lyase reactivating factor EutA [Salinivirgaceae bacterium]|nr:ethanolamine ammonia-lyase reactivating factor EutA [Salinivirgaceae bacterium]